MQLSNVLFMLLGAALVAIGVLATALADRIRGGKFVRDVPQQRERPSRAHSAPVIPVVEPAELPRPAAKPQRPRPEPKPVAATEGGEDVIAALVASGYKKPIATEQTWACTAAERATIEGWTAAALRRCARGGMS
jgi:hypothetical protein